MVKEVLPTSVRLDPQLKEWLEARARADDRPLASLLRKAIREWAEREGYAGRDLDAAV